VKLTQANESEPLMRCRKHKDAIETGPQSMVRDEVREMPTDCPSGGRHEDGASVSIGFCAEHGNL